METTLATFKQFANLEEAIEVQQILTNNGIETRLADNVPILDTNFTGSTVNNRIEIQIPTTNFKEAETLLQQYANNTLDTIDKDYYLYAFTNEELFDVLLKFDEWGELDYQLAQKILTERGKTVDEALLKSLKNQRLKDLAQPEPNAKSWIVAGYLFAFLGGLLGLLLGYMLFSSKRILPDGRKVYSYRVKDRKQGKIIFYISLVTTPLTLLYKAFLPMFIG